MPTLRKHLRNKCGDRDADSKVDWLLAPIPLAQAPIRRQSTPLSQSAPIAPIDCANRSWRQSGANPMRQSERRQSNISPSRFTVWMGLVTEQPAVWPARDVDWLQAPIDWRQSIGSRGSVCLDHDLEAPIVRCPKPGIALSVWLPDASCSLRALC